MDILQKYDKSRHLESARTWVENDDVQALRYACLELRYFIEAHVYQQLLAGADSVPATVIETWQPPKAIKILSEFDVLADQNLYLEVREKDGTLKTTIEYKNIPMRELNKTYNSLGSYLHLPTPKKVRTYSIDREKIKSIINDLSRLNDGNTIFADLGYKHFECEACKSKVVYTDYYIQNHESIDCQNDQCGITYHLIKSNDSVGFVCKYVFDCGICNNKAFVYYSKIKEGYSFECQECATQYSFRMVLHTPGNNEDS